MNKKISFSILVSLMLNNLYADTNRENSFDKIIVTANKLEENILDIPQNIMVMDNVTIENKRLRSIEDIVKSIPNMRAKLLDGVSMNYRGINSSVFTNNNPVVIYVDGIPTNNRYGFDFSLLNNIKRIEVLKGPQGTLYGKNAIGGVINIITQKPNNETSINLSFEYGKNNHNFANLNLTTPLIDNTLFLGLNLEGKQDDGWITNQYNNDDKAGKEKDYKLNTYLAYEKDKLKTKLVLNKTTSKDYIANEYGLANGSLLSDFKRDDVKNVNYNIPTHMQEKIFSQAFNLRYDFDNFHLDTVTTHKKIDYVANYDLDFSNSLSFGDASIFNTFTNDLLSQEIRLSNQSKTLKWLVGLYLDKEDKKTNPYGYDAPTFNYFERVDSRIKSRNSALFAQTTIPFKNFEATFGARLQNIEKKVDFKTYDKADNQFFAMNDKKDWNTFLPKAALLYKINPNLNSYISIAKGYMPGGYNNIPSTGTKEDNSFKPQQSINYEIGLKGVVNNLSFSASIFKMDIKDIHIYKIQGASYVTSNAKKAHSQGIELDFNYFVNDTIEIGGAVGLISAKYDDYDSGFKKYDGEKIEETPSHTANFYISYINPNGFYGFLNIRNQGDERIKNDALAEFITNKGYTTVDLKLGYKKDNLELYAYANNLTDKSYIQNFRSGLVSVATFGDPRTFGIGVKYSF